MMERVVEIHKEFRKDFSMVKRLSILVISVLVATMNTTLLYSLSDEQRRSFDGGARYNNIDAPSICTTGGGPASAGGSAPANIPEPLRTIFTTAAQTHNADPTIVAVIYAIENALYQNDQHLGSDWLIDRVNSNDWAVSGGGARGPFQFLDGTWAGYQQEGPYLYEDGEWTTNEGPGDGINVNHIDDAAYGAAEFIASIGGANGISLGSLDQDFSRDSTLENTVAEVFKSYNAGPATWRDENGIWVRNVNGTPTAWGSRKQTEINNYIPFGLEMYTDLVGGATSGAGAGCGSVFTGAIDIINLSTEADEWPEFRGSEMTNPSAIALHWTAGNPNTTGRNFISAIAGREGLCCSVQFFVNASGEIFQYTDPIHERTGHIANWNNYAIGIEIGAGSDGTIATAEREIMSQPAQRESVIQLVLFLMETYDIPVNGRWPTECSQVNAFNPTGVIGHIDYPCSTKVDPSQVYLDQIRAAVGG